MASAGDVHNLPPVETGVRHRAMSTTCRVPADSSHFPRSLGPHRGIAVSHLHQVWHHVPGLIYTAGKCLFAFLHVIYVLPSLVLGRPTCWAPAEKQA